MKRNPAIARLARGNSGLFSNPSPPWPSGDDGAAFELMCSEYGRFCIAVAKERAQGSAQETPNGYEAPTTWHSIAVKSQEWLLKLFAAFGMMPHQRAIRELSDDLVGQL